MMGVHEFEMVIYQISAHRHATSEIVDGGIVDGGIVDGGIVEGGRS
jgi:hypothetical protein